MLKKLLFLGLLAFCTAKVKITTISDYKTNLGGAPIWDAKRLSLYYVDVFGMEFELYRYDWAEKKIYRASVPINLTPKVVDFLIPIADSSDMFAIGVANRVAKIIRWDGKSTTAEIVESNLFSVEQDPKYDTNWWHIAVADPKGRFFGGTYRNQLCGISQNANASLYRYTKETGVEQLQGDFRVVGGMDWNTDTNTFYLVDVCRSNINAFDWNPDTGHISNARTVYKTYEGDGAAPYVPISLANDRDGNLYLSMFYNSSVWKVNPKTSERLEIIPMPTEVIVNLVFGGPNLDVLFVTSAAMPVGIHSGLPTNKKLTPEAGSLFMVEGLNSKGFDGRKMAKP